MARVFGELAISIAGRLTHRAPHPLGHVAAGRLRSLAVTSRGRSTALPDVPTLLEAGIRGVEITGWQGFIGPKGLPGEIITRLNSVFAEVQNIPEVRRTLEADGYEIDQGTPEEFAAFIKDEYERWGALIQEEGIPAHGNLGG